MKEASGLGETVVCGGTAGLVSRFCIAPLDVLKIRLQLQSGTQRRYTGILHGIRRIVAEEGVRGLWKGNVPAEFLYVTYAATQFVTYRAVQDVLSGAGGEAATTTTTPFVAGAVAGAVATTVTYPFDLLRTRFAAQGVSRVYRGGMLHACRAIHASEGMLGMYRGLSASLVQIVPYMGLLFGTYEPTRALLERHGVATGWDSAAAGVVAGTLSKSGVFPLDVIRKRLQVQGPSRTAYVLSDIPLYHGSLSCAVKILQTEGARGLYKGLAVSLLKSAPSSAITLWTFEQSARVLHYAQDKLGRQ